MGEFLAEDQMLDKLDELIKRFDDVQILIKKLETSNKNTRNDIKDLICCEKFKRSTAESEKDGWEYTNEQHSCSIRPSVRHYIDKERLPRDVYMMYGQLQEIHTIYVSKCDERRHEHDERVDTGIGLFTYKAKCLDLDHL
jgi:hypothetical protein